MLIENVQPSDPNNNKNNNKKNNNDNRQGLLACNKDTFPALCPALPCSKDVIQAGLAIQVKPQAIRDTHIIDV